MQSLLWVGCLTWFTLYAGCAQRDLRGWSEESPDGKTYFLLDDTDGTNCPPVFIDGQEVSWQPGRKLEISPGHHFITCGYKADVSQSVAITVEEGMTYHFTYWGP